MARNLLRSSDQHRSGQLDTRFLETFLAVVERGSLAEAARCLNLSPAAVGQRITTLEAELGHTLFRRSGRTVHPTINAAAIVEQSRSILAQVRDLRALAAIDRPVGRLRIGAISTIATGYLPAVLRRFIPQFPGIELHIVPGASSGLHEQLQAGALDAAFIVEPPFELAKTLVWRTIREEDMIVIAPPGEAGHHPHDVLRRHRFIRCDRNHWGGRLADAYLTCHRLELNEQIELDSLETIAIMVNEGIGAALVPDWAPPWPGNLNICKIPLPAPAPQRRIGLVWRSPSAVEHLIKRLLGAVTEETSNSRVALRPVEKFGVISASV